MRKETTGAVCPNASPPQIAKPKPRRRHYISWDEFCALNPPDDVRADVALSIFGPGRYTADVLPQTWKFLRRIGAGVSLHGSPR